MYEAFYNWLETNPMQPNFALLLLEKETGLVSELNKYGEVKFTNPKNSKHGLAVLMDGVTVKFGGKWDIVVEPSRPEPEVTPMPVVEEIVEEEPDEDAIN